MTPTNNITNICVYCASRSRVDPAFFHAAQELGRLIAQRAGTLVFGGNNVGLMNTVADSALQHGAHIIGVTPRLMYDRGYAYTNAHNLIVTDDMRSRKQTMEQHAHAFIALPGGFGTLEEVFEILTAKHLGSHNKPVIFLNTQNFYHPLHHMFEHIFNTGFAKSAYRRYYHFAPTPADAFDYLDQYTPPQSTDKWM